MPVIDDSEPGEDYNAWVPIPKVETPSRRWCPTHRTYEANPPGRLMCGPAWKELYQMEREVEVERMSPNLAILTLADQLGELIIEMRHSGIIADPPPKPKPQDPRPPIAPPPVTSRHGGKGGVALP